MEKVVYIKNRQNVKMALKLNVAPERKKCAFLEHGLGARKEYPHMRVLEEYFAKNGYNVINIDATNSLNESGQTAEGITFLGHYHDLEDAIAWAKSQDFYKEPFALAGQSLGAAACLKYAGEFPEKVNFLICASCPFIDGNELIKNEPMMIGVEQNGFFDKLSKSTGKTLHLTRAINEDLKRQNLSKQIAKITAKTFVVQGLKDSKYIINCANRIFELLNCEKVFCPLNDVPHDLANTPENEKEFRRLLSLIFTRLNFSLCFDPISTKNIKSAIRIQKTLFPHEEGAQDLIDSLNGCPPPHQFMQKHWVATLDGKPIGLVGLYAYRDYPKEAWLGWFGVLPQHRRKGFGRQIFEFAKNEASLLGFETLRLYTDEEDNFLATKLYEKLGMQGEYYENKEDSYHTASRVLIYSISLTDKPCEKWNSKNLSLGGHEKWNSPLQAKPFTKNSTLAKEVRRIYESNFPENERTPFDELFAGKFKNASKVAYLIGGKVAGLTIYYKEDSLIYLIWLAVDKSQQGKGIGSQIIRTLHEQNTGCSIALNIENPYKTGCTDRDLREKRERFYTKNGFTRSGLVFDCFGEEWLPLCLGEVDLDKYMKIESLFYPDTSNIRKI